MGQGISEILTYAVGVAVSPVPIIAVTLMLFSQRARVNGLMFLLGWVLALALVSGVAYALADQANAATDTTTSDTVAWGKSSSASSFSCWPRATGAPVRELVPSPRCPNGWQASTPSSPVRRSVWPFYWRESIRRT